MGSPGPGHGPQMTGDQVTQSAILIAAAWIMMWLLPAWRARRFGPQRDRYDHRGIAFAYLCALGFMAFLGWGVWSNLTGFTRYVGGILICVAFWLPPAVVWRSRAPGVSFRKFWFG